MQRPQWRYAEAWRSSNNPLPVRPYRKCSSLHFATSVKAHSYFRGALAGNDPWDAWTLEWATTSPPPPYNFEVVPEVSSRRPLWDLKHPDDPDGPHE